MVVTEYFSCYLYYFHYLHKCNDVNIVIKFQKLKDNVEFLCYCTSVIIIILIYLYFSPFCRKKNYPPWTSKFVIFIFVNCLIYVSSLTLPDLNATPAQQYYANSVEECRKC